MATTMNVIKTIRGSATEDGAGVKLTRVLGHDTIYDADPFLMLDAFDSTNPEDYLKGFPLHPHRGIETVTYLISGQIDHRDSLGNRGTIGPGQAQWMTAGRGILHEEMPQESNHMLGFQLWINLPREEKMVAPHYYNVTEDVIERVEYDWGIMRVIAGEYDGHHGAYPRYVQASVFDISVNPGQSFSLSIQEGHTVLAYVIEGEGTFGEGGRSKIPAKTMGFFGEGTEFTVVAGEQGLRFMLFYGKPLNEPIAWGGPIVMNTEEELWTAFKQLEQRTFIS